MPKKQVILDNPSAKKALAMPNAPKYIGQEYRATACRKGTQEDAALFQKCEQLRAKNHAHQRYCKMILPDTEKMSDLRHCHTNYIRHTHIDPVMKDKWGQRLLKNIHPSEISDTHEFKKRELKSLFGTSGRTEKANVQLPDPRSQLYELCELKYTLFPETRPKTKKQEVIANMKEDLFSVLRGHKTNEDSTGAKPSKFKDRSKMTADELMIHEFVEVLIERFGDSKKLPLGGVIQAAFNRMDVNRNANVSLVEFEDFCVLLGIEDRGFNWSVVSLFRLLDRELGARKTGDGCLDHNKFILLHKTVDAINEERKLEKQSEALKEAGVDLSDKKAMVASAKKILDEQHKSEVVNDLTSQHDGLRALFRQSKNALNQDHPPGDVPSGDSSSKDPESLNNTRKSAILTAIKTPPLGTFPGGKKDGEENEEDKKKEDENKAAPKKKARFKFAALAEQVGKKAVIQKTYTKEEREAMKKKMQYDMLESMYNRLYNNHMRSQEFPFLEARSHGQRCLHGPERYRIVPAITKMHEMSKEYAKVQQRYKAINKSRWEAQQANKNRGLLRFRGGTLIYNEQESKDLRCDLGVLNYEIRRRQRVANAKISARGIDMDEFKYQFANIHVYHDREPHYEPKRLTIRTSQEGLNGPIEGDYWEQACQAITKKIGTGMIVRYLHEAKTLKRINKIEDVREGGVYVAGALDENLDLKQQHPNFTKTISPEVARANRPPKLPILKKDKNKPAPVSPMSASNQDLVDVREVLDECFAWTVQCRMSKNFLAKNKAEKDYRYMMSTRKQRMQKELDIQKKMKDDYHDLMASVTMQSTIKLPKILSPEEKALNVAEHYLSSKPPEKVSNADDDTVFVQHPPPESAKSPLARDSTRPVVQMNLAATSMVDVTLPQLKAAPEGGWGGPRETEDTTYLGAISPTLFTR